MLDYNKAITTIARAADNSKHANMSGAFCFLSHLDKVCNSVDMVLKKLYIISQRHELRTFPVFLSLHVLALTK